MTDAWTVYLDNSRKTFHEHVLNTSYKICDCTDCWYYREFKSEKWYKQTVHYKMTQEVLHELKLRK